MDAGRLGLLVRQPGALARQRLVAQLRDDGRPVRLCRLPALRPRGGLLLAAPRPARLGHGHPDHGRALLLLQSHGGADPRGVHRAGAVEAPPPDDGDDGDGRDCADGGRGPGQRERNRVEPGHRDRQLRRSERLLGECRSQRPYLGLEGGSRRQPVRVAVRARRRSGRDGS